MKYTFFNFSDTPFTGRFGGQPYPFTPGETQSFDPDKHYMLIVMAKQLADRELLRKAVSVGKNPNDLGKFGKALDAAGNIFTMTVEGRRELMRKAIGDLLDTPIPTPDQSDEVGSTQETESDIKGLKDQVAQMKEMIEKLTALSIHPPQAPQAVQEKPQDSPSMGMARSLLEEMAVDAGHVVTPEMSKENLVNLLSPTGQVG